MEVKQPQLDVIGQLRDVVGKAYEALRDETISLRSIKDDVFYLLQKKLELTKELEVMNNAKENSKMQAEGIVQKGREEAEKIKRMATERLAEAARDREAAARELESAKKANTYAQKELSRVKAA